MRNVPGIEAFMREFNSGNELYSGLILFDSVALELLLAPVFCTSNDLHRWIVFCVIFGIVLDYSGRSQLLSRVIMINECYHANHRKIPWHAGSMGYFIVIYVLQSFRCPHTARSTALGSELSRPEHLHVQCPI